jgi:hypothetical protein
LAGTDQAALEGKHAEQRVAMGVHGKSPPRAPGVGFKGETVRFFPACFWKPHFAEAGVCPRVPVWTGISQMCIDLVVRDLARISSAPIGQRPNARVQGKPARSVGAAPVGNSSIPWSVRGRHAEIGVGIDDSLLGLGNRERDLAVGLFCRSVREATGESGGLVTRPFRSTPATTTATEVAAMSRSTSPTSARAKRRKPIDSSAGSATIVPAARTNWRPLKELAFMVRNDPDLPE